MRANLGPGVALWLFGISILVFYYLIPVSRPAFDFVSSLKARHGFLFSIISTAFFGGLLPFLFLAASGRIPQGRIRSEFIFCLSLWAFRGFDVDLFYRLQAVWFGSEPGFRVVFSKILVDQLIYCPLWATPLSVFIYRWKDYGFGWGNVSKCFTWEMAAYVYPSTMMATWLVWFPAVTVVYALPSDLQIPIFSIVLCFYVLALNVLTEPRKRHRRH